MESELPSSEKAASQLQALERMIELIGRLEKVADQLIEIAANDADDQLTESQ